MKPFRFEIKKILHIPGFWMVTAILLLIQIFLFTSMAWQDHQMQSFDYVLEKKVINTYQNMTKETMYEMAQERYQRCSEETDLSLEDLIFYKKFTQRLFI